jgi:hypothetical protein
MAQTEPQAPRPMQWYSLLGIWLFFFFGGTYLLEGFCYEVHRDEWTFIASRRVRLHTEVWFSNWLNQTCQNMTVGDIRYGQSTHVTEGLRTTFRRHQS